MFNSLKKALFEEENKNPSMEQFLGKKELKREVIKSETVLEQSIENFEKKDVDRTGLSIPEVSQVYETVPELKENKLFKVEQFYDGLESVPNNLKAGIIKNIIETAGMNIEDLLIESNKRKEVLRNYLEQFTGEKNQDISELESDIENLKQKITEKSERISQYSNEIDCFTSDVFAEIKRIENIESYLGN